MYCHWQEVRRAPVRWKHELSGSKVILMEIFYQEGQEFSVSTDGGRDRYRIDNNISRGCQSTGLE
jgi:hypothetical protein